MSEYTTKGVKEKVQECFPDARTGRSKENNWYILNGEQRIGWGRTEDEAWADAARRIALKPVGGGDG